MIFSVVIFFPMWCGMHINITLYIVCISIIGLLLLNAFACRADIECYWVWVINFCPGCQCPCSCLSVVHFRCHLPVMFIAALVVCHIIVCLATLIVSSVYERYRSVWNIQVRDQLSMLLGSYDCKLMLEIHLLMLLGSYNC